MSINTSLPWTEEFIEKYINKWNWEKMSWNTNLPWTEVFIQKYIDYWNWKSLCSMNIDSKTEAEIPVIEDINIELVNKFIDKWDWKLLAEHNYLYKNSFELVLNDELVDAVMEEIAHD